MYDTWTMADGKQILIIDMTDSHLLNTISMINRNKRINSVPQYRELIKEANKRRLKILTTYSSDMGLDPYTWCTDCGGKKRGFYDDYFIYGCYCIDLKEYDEETY